MTEPTGSRQEAEPTPARETWDTDVPGDADAAPESATLPDQVGDDYTLREATAGEEAPGYQAPPFVQEGESFARSEEPAGAAVPSTESSGRPERQDGDGFARTEVPER